MSTAAFSVVAADDSRFSVAVGSHDNLVISGPNGAPVTEVPPSTLGKGVQVGDNHFQVSYGRDANGELTAILTSPTTDAIALHFSAGGKNIDVNKAVVTLTFAPKTQGVQVDPGYVGTVEVDSHVLRAHSLADDLPPVESIMPASAVAAQTSPEPAPTATPAPVAPTSLPETADETATAPAPDAAAASDDTATDRASDSAMAPAPVFAPSSPATSPNATGAGVDSSPLPTAPPLLASQLKPLLPPLPNAAPNIPEEQRYHSTLDDTLAASTHAISPDEVRPMKLYWSEPITAPDGTAPVVGADEIRLVEVRGEVTVVARDGNSQAGSEGMVVTSGSTVRTAENSSAALFMGGVNSARLMPKCELVVTQTFANSIRTDVINLHAGAVFSRIGHRDGETENYTVATPEGTSDPGSSDMLAFRGTPADFRGTASMTRAGLTIDPTRLLAWNPAPARGLISDVATANLGIPTPIGNIPDTYYYYTGGFRLSLNANLIKHQVLENYSANATPSDTEPEYVLQAVLQMLQPYNVKLNKLLNAINNGTETPAQLTYYHNLITVFFDQQAPNLVNNILQHPNGFARVLNQDSAMLWQDLREFKLTPLTAH